MTVNTVGATVSTNAKAPAILPSYTFVPSSISSSVNTVKNVNIALVLF